VSRITKAVIVDRVGIAPQRDPARAMKQNSRELR
jgi:hypothetical protein